MFTFFRTFKADYSRTLSQNKRPLRTLIFVYTLFYVVWIYLWVKMYVFYWFLDLETVPHPDVSLIFTTIRCPTWKVTKILPHVKNTQSIVSNIGTQWDAKTEIGLKKKHSLNLISKRLFTVCVLSAAVQPPNRGTVESLCTACLHQAAKCSSFRQSEDSVHIVFFSSPHLSLWPYTIHSTKTANVDSCVTFLFTDVPIGSRRT